MPRSVDRAALLQLCARVNAASTVDELAGHVLDGLGSLVDARVAAVVLFHPDGRPRMINLKGGSDRITRRYEEWMPHDPLLTELKAYPVPMHDMRLQSEDAWRRSLLYQEFGSAERLRHYGVSPTFMNGQLLGAIACARDDGASELGDKELGVLQTVCLRFQDRFSSLETGRPCRPSSLEARVRDSLRRSLRNGESTAKQTAKRVKLAERTLHRNLSKEGTTFQKILDQVRLLELAVFYLDETELSVGEIANMLAYEPSSFARAFRDRHGHSPRDRRQRAGVKVAR